jgi:hypothetical protein
MDGTLSGTIGALNEMRLEDLQQSVRHAKKMSELLNALTTAEPNAAPLDQLIGPLDPPVKDQSGVPNDTNGAADDKNDEVIVDDGVEENDGR